ncbi:MAG TPA: VOC family protein [Steroidobacteraceae bacterium]|nr:VOC family protein [Steroidobacteraceae bacterium]
MHKSRLGGIIIDCRTDDLESAAQFWSRALGFPIRGSTAEEDRGYSILAARGDQYAEVQRVAHESRVHLDIETDDVEAEVRRLERLGARRVQQVRSWWVMEAPTGQRFCVVPVVNAAFDRDANRWEQGS